LSRALGDKDHLRDFFTGRKESLKPETISPAHLQPGPRAGLFIF
jgi:hypothetical protein